ncbi:MAG: ABC transporter ATP-binding protein [Candidatus Kapabacteria bacterium]|nr:ABC transporter ATP-binding protein [Candidatus Kapabacteria bacterium]
MKNNLKLIANSLSKSFYLNKPIFSDISFKLQSTDIFGIAGENGSGKSTLLKILAGVSTPSAGTVNIFIDEKKIDNSNHFEILGFVSPYLSIYEEFTPIEHFYIASKIKGTKQNSSLEIELLKKFKLFNRKNDQIKTFSSGMKQRIKFILAFSSQPKIVFLDEPFTNLDNEGINIVRELIEQHKINNGITIIASNDDREKSLCNEIIELKKRNNQ